MILSVQKAMQILLVLSNAKNQPVPLTEIAAKTGYPKPTCSHLLETLCHEGYVVRVSQTKGYTLGPSLYCLTRYGRYGEELVSLCRPVMRWMEQKTHATVVLSTIQSGLKFIVDYADNEQNLFVDRPKIRTDDIYRTATGRAILAQMGHEEVAEIYRKYGPPPTGHWSEVTSYETLVKALDIIRCQDVVISGIENGQITHKNVGFACPLFQNRTCIGAIGLAWKNAEETLSPSLEEELIKTLRKGTREIHRRLHYGEKDSF